MVDDFPPEKSSSAVGSRTLARAVVEGEVAFDWSRQKIPVMFDCTAAAPADAATPNSLSQLAPEIAHRILVLVADYRSLARLCCVSKLWSIRAADDAYWRPLFLARWRAPRSLPNGTRGITLALESNEEGVLMTEDDDHAERVAWKKLYKHRLALDLHWTRVCDSLVLEEQRQQLRSRRKWWNDPELSTAVGAPASLEFVESKKGRRKRIGQGYVCRAWEAVLLACWAA
ncbi:hypothetical protein DFJ73DRAFT_766125 [Zopfochytrium polystomum]|nr:hypothetical protein DFJ73DRAFT_766125 [Zopfochytrium polystomum]